jgi:hypothetical protein
VIDQAGRLGTAFGTRRELPGCGGCRGYREIADFDESAGLAEHAEHSRGNHASTGAAIESVIDRFQCPT